MAGVLASTSVGFALEEPMKQRMMKPLDDVLARNVPGAKKLRREVDDTVWRARNAVHAQLTAELDARGPEWENWKRDIGDYTWDQVWQTIGDPLYSQGSMSPSSTASAGSRATAAGGGHTNSARCCASGRPGSRCSASTSPLSSATAGPFRPERP